MMGQLRQLPVDYALIHEYLSWINYKYGYSSIFLVEKVNNKMFVIRLKRGGAINTAPVYVTKDEWDAFLAQRDEK